MKIMVEKLGCDYCKDNPPSKACFVCGADLCNNHIVSRVIGVGGQPGCSSIVRAEYPCCNSGRHSEQRIVEKILENALLEIEAEFARYKHNRLEHLRKYEPA